MKSVAMVLNRDHLAEFAKVLSNARKITVLTGAGVSAESGIPTFRGEGGLWRNWNAVELATPEAFRENPSLVWEFYHYRRSEPFLAVIVLQQCICWILMKVIKLCWASALQQRCKQDGKAYTLLTQNIDGLHMVAGSTDVVELHGSLWKTRCYHCVDVQENREMPICAALDGKGAPDTVAPDARIPPMQLPRCKLCNGMLRPHVVWFGESLDRKILREVDSALENCDLLLVAGTSAVVYPAAGYAPLVSALGGEVAEFNIDDTPVSSSCRFKFRGPSASTLPEALGIPLVELSQEPPSSDTAAG